MVAIRKIVGLNSPAPQSGKSTVAQAYAERDGGLVLSIAGGIRDMARDIGLEVAADAQGAAKDQPHDELGGRTPRNVLIAIGNTMRHAHGEGYWISRLFEKIAALPADNQLIIIDDVRTQMEGDAVFLKGGCVITIERPGATPNPNDVQGYQPVVTIQNDGTIDECVERVGDVADDFFAEMELAA